MIRALACALFASVVFVAPARAGVDLFSADTVSALVDVRAGVSGGEESWTRGGYGKTRMGGGGGGEDVQANAEISEAAVSWKPRLDWTWSGVFNAQFQPGQDHEVDLVEAYLNYKPVPTSPIRFSARAGMFWPEISMEHGDPFWGVSYAITPSAINTWVGEEIKVVGAEAKLSAPIAGGNRLSATAGVFGDNDTSGTLLALRGWALDDLKSAAWSTFPLPRLDAPFARIWRGQKPFTEPTRHDIDKRLGFYGRAEWQTPLPVSLNLFYYDNGGNPTKVESGQWAWDTRFWNVGASWDLDADTRILSQVMWGQTIEGFPTPQGVWIDVGFSSAYLLATHSFGADRLTARVDYFRTRDRTWQFRDNNNERGWAATASWRRDLSENVSLISEVIHVASDRPARAYQGVDRETTSTVLQSSMRLRF